MPVPAVSEKQWQQTRAISQLYLGTPHIGPDELSFEDQLGTILDAELAADDPLKADTNTTVDQYVQTEGMFKGPKFVGKETKSHWFDSQAPEVIVTYEAGERDHPRRPEISEDTITSIEQLVKREFEGVPTDTLSFDKKLEMLYKHVQRSLASYGMYPITKEEYESGDWEDDIELIEV